MFLALFERPVESATSWVNGRPEAVRKTVGELSRVLEPTCQRKLTLSVIPLRWNSERNGNGLPVL